MKPSIYLSWLSRIKLGLALSLIRSAGADVHYEIRHVRANSERDVAGRRHSSHGELGPAMADFESTSVPADHKQVLSLRGTIFESGVNAPILERKQQPATQEPERHGAGWPTKTVVDPFLDDRSLARRNLVDNISILASGPTRQIPNGLDHQHNQNGPMEPVDGVYVATCSVCGEPQPGDDDATA